MVENVKHKKRNKSISPKPMLSSTNFFFIIDFEYKKPTLKMMAIKPKFINEFKMAIYHPIVMACIVYDNIPARGYKNQ